MNNKASRKRGAFLFKPQRHEEHEDASLCIKKKSKILRETFVYFLPSWFKIYLCVYEP